MSGDASQEKLLVDGDSFRDCIGCTFPEIVLYTGNRPGFSIDMCSKGVLSVPELILLNGNHWRKIFTIFAKLTSSHDDWRVYRDSALLHQREAICFSGTLVESAAIHVIAGKASWAHLALDMKAFQPLDEEHRVWVKDNILCTPYFDYRQFPNVLIELVQKWIAERLDRHKF